MGTVTPAKAGIQEKLKSLDSASGLDAYGQEAGQARNDETGQVMGFQPSPFGTGIASPHDPALKAGVSKSTKNLPGRRRRTIPSRRSKWTFSCPVTILSHSKGILHNVDFFSGKTPFPVEPEGRGIHYRVGGPKADFP